MDIPTLDTNADILAIESKFTVESDEMIGGVRKKTRITFEGFCSKELYLELASAVRKVVGE